MRTLSHEAVSTKRKQIAELARSMPEAVLTTLAHHIDIEWLRVAYGKTRKSGAPGVDGQTAEEYEVNLDENLQSLLNRVKSGSYRAPPVRRAYIPKGDGGQRPIGIPTLEDKVVQRAFLMLLEAVYEQDFLPCSFGFRPGRSQHDALGKLREDMMSIAGGWVLETDIKSFFDSIDHTVLREILSKRVRDGVVTRMIGKWLNAGVLENGFVYHPESGTPQGGVISPLLGNIVLHEVVDVWFESMVKPCLRGHGSLVRFADDLVMVFEREDDARRVMKALPQRLARFGLAWNEAKTRLIEYKKPRGTGRGDAEPGTFDFLGFTHYWARSLRGYWVIKRKTVSSRFTRALRSIARWCRTNRHEPIAEQHKMLNLKLKGHYQYYGITGNYDALKSLKWNVERFWRKWLNRRSWRTRLSWRKMRKILKRFPLEEPRICHSI